MNLIAIFTLAGLYFWLVWYVASGLFDSARGRIALFIALATIIVSPVLVSDGVMYVALQPHIALLWFGGFGALVPTAYTALSFSVTALIALPIARRIVMGRPVSAALQSGKISRITRIGVLAAIVFPLYWSGYNRPPSLVVPDYITKAYVEGIYGKIIDDIIRLDGIEDEVANESEDVRIRSALRKFGAVIYVLENDRRKDAKFRFGYVRDRRKPDSYCASRGNYRESGLLRCTWWYSKSDWLDVLSYTRVNTRNGGRVRITIYFDFELFNEDWKERHAESALNQGGAV